MQGRVQFTVAMKLIMQSCCGCGLGVSVGGLGALGAEAIIQHFLGTSRPAVKCFHWHAQLLEDDALLVVPSGTTRVHPVACSQLAVQQEAAVAVLSPRKGLCFLGLNVEAAAEVQRCRHRIAGLHMDCMLGWRCRILLGRTAGSTALSRCPAILVSPCAGMGPPPTPHPNPNPQHINITHTHNTCPQPSPRFTRCTHLANMHNLCPPPHPPPPTHHTGAARLPPPPPAPRPTSRLVPRLAAAPPPRWPHC